MSFSLAAAALPDARNPLKALQRLRQDPDSTEFVYLRPFRVDETMPMNPYHLEIVSHADIDEVSYVHLCFAPWCLCCSACLNDRVREAAK